jgi:hypothetical protein
MLLMMCAPTFSQRRGDNPLSEESYLQCLIAGVRLIPTTTTHHVRNCGPRVGKSQPLSG